MKLAIFGATGGTGKQIVAQALEAGHMVTALVRDPAKLGDLTAPITAVTGDVLDQAKVAETVNGADCVIVTLGSTANNPDWIVSEGTKQVISAMQTNGVKRLIVITSIGVGDSKDQVSFAFKMLMKTVLKKAMEDKERQETAVQESGLDWTIIRPGGLVDGPRTGEYTVGSAQEVKAGQVARADVAELTLKQIDSDEYLHKAVSIS